MSIKLVARNAAWVGVAQVVSLGFPLLTLPVAAHAFGPSIYGLIATLTASASYAGLVITFGFHLTGPRLIARTPKQADALSQAFSSVFVGQIGLAVLAFGVGLCILAAWDQPQETRAIGAVLLAGVAVSALTPMWVFVGLQAVDSLILPQLVLRSLATAVILMFVRGPGDALLFVGVNTACSGAVCVSALVSLSRRKIVLRATSLPRVVTAIRAASRLFVSAVAINLYTTTNVVVVGLVLGPTAAGYFALADRVRGAIVGLFDPLSQAMYPYLCGADAAADRERDRCLFFRTLLVLSVTSAILLYAASPLIAAFLGGERFAHAVPLLNILSLTPVLICLSNILGIQTMLPDNMERELSIIVTCAGFAGVALLVVMVAALGLDGAAWSYLAVEGSVTLALAICVRRRRPLASLFFVSPQVRRGDDRGVPRETA